MLSILSIIFAAALGVPGGCDMWETIILTIELRYGQLDVNSPRLQALGWRIARGMSL